MYKKKNCVSTSYETIQKQILNTKDKCYSCAKLKT